MLPDDLDTEKTEVRPEDIPNKLPVLPVSDAVVFPQMMVPLVISDRKLIVLAEDVLEGNRLFGAFTQRPLDDNLDDEEEEDDLASESIFRVGTIVSVQKTLRFPDGSMRILGKGICRAEISNIVSRDPYLTAVIHCRPDRRGAQRRERPLMANVCTAFSRVIDASEHMPDELKRLASKTQDAGPLADLIAANVDFKVSDKQALLESFDLCARLRQLLELLTHELQVLRLGEKLQSEIREEMDREQREYYLRQQMKAIRKELGDHEEASSEIDEVREKIDEANLPDEAREATLKELDRLARMSPASAEYTVSKTYIDLILELPWSVSTLDHHNIRRAARILDEDHYDLRKVKERILEFLAVKKLKKDMQGPILCLAGPPGVGKTSLGRSVARSLGRHFVRVSLGGMRDEAEIRGHRRTYVGALPGRIIQGLKTAGSNNPVFMLDEIDKLGSDFRGDPASALLEVLDAAQNHSFSDHYLNVPFDLSKVLFIATANLLDPIPAVLRDRMEVIDVAGYTSREKLEIAKRYLVPRQMNAHGINSSHLTLSDAGLMSIISGYTREAGVRALERSIGAVCRRVAKGVASGRKQRRRLSRDNVGTFLGPPDFLSPEALRQAEIGVATGMAWTLSGGEILFIEAVKMPGKGTLKLTGSLGPVMRESAEAALSYLRSQVAYEQVGNDFFDRHDFHVHVPAGATPKDGPSAGITIATALASLVYGSPVRSNLSMTGEVTLTGKVLPVGGVRQKLLAAFRAGIREVVLPHQNQKDLEEVPREVIDRMRIHFVESVDQVLELALRKPPQAKPRNTLVRRASRPRARERRPVARS
ncbi:MAG: endopeptidase La [Candidatus Krumholzibacteriia bacterium]